MYNHIMSIKSTQITKLLSILFVSFLFGSCNQPRQFGITPTNDGNETVATQIFAEATATQQAVIQTSTPMPLAMSVNGQSYPLSDFKQDLLRFMMVFPEMEPEEAFEMLTTDISEQLLLQQAAISNGFSISEEELNRRIADLIIDVGGEDTFNNWMSNNYFTQEQFQAALEREIAISFQKQIILDEIPEEIEQAEIYQILVYDEGTAKQIGQALAEGSDFFWLAEQYHPATLGYIGWNPQGAMLPKEVEDIVFSMEIGTYSDIVQTDYGYHILFLNSREIHKLSPENLRVLQENKLSSWMENQKQTAAIELFTDYDQ
jgi:parvulin-like peptidyl-prolyl isomerase